MKLLHDSAVLVQVVKILNKVAHNNVVSGLNILISYLCLSQA